MKPEATALRHRRPWAHLGGPLLLLATLVATLQVCRGADPQIHIDSIARANAAQLRLEFTDDGVGATAYSLMSAVNLDSGASWQLVDGFILTTIASNRFALTFPLPATTPHFYRIDAALESDEDLDGLSDDREALLGTNHADPDSDGDLFSDGIEVSLGTDPLSPIDFPALSAQPSVRFATSESKAQEGDGRISIPLEVDRPFRGTVLFKVAEVSNAKTSGDTADFAPVTGQVHVNGTTATLNLDCLDDTTIEGAKILVLDLVDDPGGRYHVGSIPRHTVVLSDNDAYWNGVMVRGSSELHFRLRLLQKGNTFAAALVSSLDASQAGGAPGVGTIPPGEWPVAITRTSSTFEAVSDPIPFATSLLFKADLTRRLTLRAVPPADPTKPDVPYKLTEKLIVGTYRDQLSAANAQLQYLDRETTGTVILAKDLSTIEAITIPTQATGAAGVRTMAAGETVRATR